MSIFWSSILRLMLPQLHERVGKWTHKPRSNFNHKKHLSDAFTFTFIFSIILFRKYKKYLLLAYTTKTQKHHYRIIFTLLHCYLLYRIAYHILFYLHLHLVFDNHSVELKKQDEKIVLQVAWRRTIGAFWLFPESLILNPELPHWENLLCYNTLHLESQQVDTFA
jgi:hypothetical protein